MVSAGNGDRTDVEIEIGKGADINRTTESGETSLFLASWQGHTDIVNVLIVAGADVEIGRNDGMTPLMMASKRGHVDIVKILLAAGADVNKAATLGILAGYTALIIAARRAIRILSEYS